MMTVSFFLLAFMVLHIAQNDIMYRRLHGIDEMDKSKTSEYQSMAAEFMDMWQRQWASALTNPETIKSMLAFFRNMQPTGVDAGGNYGNPFKSAMDAVMPGFGEYATSQHAKPASGVVEPMLAELSARLAACEGRLAALESESAARGTETGRKNGSSAAGRNGGRRPKTSRK
jgi:hypothetical protein